jgi:prepilin signal peptidase PulO-like enzyme (type II secretory pathway)
MNTLLVIFLGLVCAAFVNYLADVLPTQRQLVAPTCRACNTSFNLLNYLTFTPCRICQARRPLRDYIVLISGGLIAFSLWNWPPAIGFSLALLILTYFGVVAVIDFEHRLIMHVVSLVGAILFAMIGLILNGWLVTLLGGLAGGGVMLLFYIIGTRFSKYRAKKLGTDDDEEALGFGDVTISAVLGLLVGWPGIMLTLLIGVLLGGLFSLLTIIGLSVMRRYDPMNVFTAYGPFLLVGAVMMIFFREPVLRFFFGG